MTKNFTEALIEDYGLIGGDNPTATQLLSYIQALDAEVFSERGNLYLPYDLETEIFKFLATHYTEIRNPICLDLAKKLSKCMFKILRGIKTNEHPDGGILKDGQMVYNASAVTEHNLHNSFKWAFGGKDKYDHTCEHTGFGDPTPDFILTEDSHITVYAKDSDVHVKVIDLFTDDGIDAKDYISYESMEIALKANTDGKLGHNGKYLICHLIGSSDYYFTENHAGAPIYKVIDQIEADPERKQVKLFDDEGLLVVSYF